MKEGWILKTYIVQWKPSHIQTYWNNLTGILIPSVEITNLTSNAEYQFAIIAENEAGASHVSDATNAITSKY